MQEKISYEEFKKDYPELVSSYIFSRHQDSGDQESLMRVIQEKPYLWCAEKACEIAQYADSVDHHPRILFGYDDEGKTYLNIITFTHTAKGVTKKDIDLANKIEEIIRN